MSDPSRSAEHRVLLTRRKNSEGDVVLDPVIETEGGPCPGHLVIRTDTVPTQTKPASDLIGNLEHLAYVLAKQIQAGPLEEGIGDHVQGHWLLWQGSH